MATHDYVIANGTGAAVRSDLNNALAAIVSNNSGSSEPGTTYAYQWWADTNANVLKIRNSSNDGWITLRELDGTMLIEDGSASTPGLAFADDVNTGIFSPAADQIGFATGGAERLEIGSSEVVFNDPSNDVDFRVESNGNTHMLFVDAGNDRVGVGASSPNGSLSVQADSGRLLTFRNSTTGTGASDGSYITLSGSDLQISNAESANTIFYTGDTERARIDSSGRLLVGTSTARSNVLDGDGGNTLTPQFQFETANSDTAKALSVIFGRNNTNGAEIVLGKHRSASVGGTTIVSDGDQLGSLTFSGSDGTNFIPAATIEANVDATPGTNDMPGRLVFSTCADGASSPTERVRIDSSGNVGISTTTTSGANLVIATNSNGGSGIKLIGKSANGGAEIDFRNNADSTLNGFIEFNDNGGILSTVVNQPQVFRTNNTERMRIDSSGQLLINQTAVRDTNAFIQTDRSSGPMIVDIRSQDLSNAQVCNFTARGSSGSGGTRIAQIGLYKNSSNINPGAYLRMDPDDGSTNYVYFDNSNLLRFSTSSGNIGLQSGTVIGTQTSDERLKNIAGDVTYGLAEVKQLQPKQYALKTEPDTNKLGFIAQQVESIIPEAVFDSNDELPGHQEGDRTKLGMEYVQLIPVLVNAIKELSAEVDTLKTKVAALEAG